MLKKELIGNFFRAGKLYTQERICVHDHDFRSLSTGIAVPHGLYDVYRNIGYVTIGTSHDTSEFAIAGIRTWWLTHGRLDYSLATSILLLCDCGGSNNARYYIFKQDLQQLADELGIEIRMTHYPPTHPNTIRLNTVFFLISHGLVRVLSSRALNLLKNNAYSFR